MSTPPLPTGRGPALARRWLLPWALALGALLNLAWPTFRHYDFSHSPDTRSYLRLAAGRFDSVNVTRRYRVLVPLAAGALARPLAALGGPAGSAAAAGEWPRRTAFYLLNCLLLGAAGACWWRTARLTGASPGATAAALLAVLSSQWAGYAAGLPLTDSLYWLVAALAYYAGRRGPGAGWAAAAALLLGPLAKESFLLLVPWLAWWGRPALAGRWQALALAGGLLALLLVHRGVDAAAGSSGPGSLPNALGHFGNVRYSLALLATPRGWLAVGSSFGLFWLPVLAALAGPTGRRALAALGPAPAATWLLVVLAHLLLSGDLGRMAYLAAPVFVGALALAFEWLAGWLGRAAPTGRGSRGRKTWAARPPAGRAGRPAG